MQALDIALISTDIEYANALAVAIIRNGKGFNVDAFYDVAAASSLASYDIVLSDMVTEKKDDGSIRPNKLIWLSEKYADYDIDNYTLYKYANVRDLVSDILLLYTRISGSKLVTQMKDDVDIYLFASPYGGSGCTLLARMYAAMMQECGSRDALYVPLAAIAEPQTVVQDTYNIRHYLYYLEAQRSEYSAIDKFLARNDDGYMTFRQPEVQNPLCELGGKRMRKFIESLTVSGKLGSIIFDAGNTIGERVEEIAKSATEIYIVKDDRDVSTARARYEAEMFGDAIIYMHNKYTDNKTADTAGKTHMVRVDDPPFDLIKADLKAAAALQIQKIL